MTKNRPISGTGEPTSESLAGETGEPRLTAAQGQATGGIPDDPEALAEDIERTRERLGDTVEALTAKLDVTARARDRAGQVKDRIVDVTGDVTGKIAGKTGNLKQQLSTGNLKQQLSTGNLKQQLTTTTARVRRAAGQRSVPFAAVAGLVLLVGAWLTRAIKRR
jgi:uncharacterized protein DUF3618